MATTKKGKGKGNDGYGEENPGKKIGTAIIDGINFKNLAVQYVEVDGLAMFEGDIILGKVEDIERNNEIRRQEMRGELSRGVVISGSQYRWPNCVIPYTIDSSLPNQARVTDAIVHWESNTNIRFVLRTSANASQYPDYVTLRPGSGCSSYVGRQGGQQFINLAGGCSTGNTIHEIGHTVGLWHEQSREDRDSFVTIHWDKIQSGYEHNFNQRITDGDDVGTYDYGSIMHYHRTAFSIDGSDTITPTDSSAVIGQRAGLSPGDIAAANSLCPPRVSPHCPPAPRLCAVAPRITCPPAPRLACPPAPRIACPPAPRIACPPAPRIACPPAPHGGCWAGPYMRPNPEIPVVRPGFYTPNYPAPAMYRDPYHSGMYGYQSVPEPYGYGEWYGYSDYADPYYAYDEYTAGYGDPYGYDWTMTEYPEEYGEAGLPTSNNKGRFDPHSEG